MIVSSLLYALPHFSLIYPLGSAFKDRTVGFGLVGAIACAEYVAEHKPTTSPVLDAVFMPLVLGLFSSVGFFFYRCYKAAAEGQKKYVPVVCALLFFGLVPVADILGQTMPPEAEDRKQIQENDAWHHVHALSHIVWVGSVYASFFLTPPTKGKTITTTKKKE